MAKFKSGMFDKIENNIINKETSYINYYDIDIEYELLSPIIKDIQLVSQLIKFNKNRQLSDLIFIKGNNSYSIESRFYFNYRNIIDFYIKVLDYKENADLTQLKYYIYKTHSSSRGFIVILTIYNISNKSSKVSIELILYNSIKLTQTYINIINNEFSFNINLLIKSIKSNKQQFLIYGSNIIKNDFFALSQIIQNKKLIKYLINGQFKKITINNDDNSNNNINNNNNNNDDNSFIRINDIYKIIIKKKENNNNLLYDYINENNIFFKVKLIKIKEDNIIIQYEILSNNDNAKNDKDNSFYNIVTIIIRKITNTYSFILIKYIWDKSLEKNLIIAIKKFINKILIKIEKLCTISC